MIQHRNSVPARTVDGDMTGEPGIPAVEAIDRMAPKVRHFYENWAVQRRARKCLPAWRDIQPYDIASCLSGMVVMDVVAGDENRLRFKIRLSGTGLDAIWSANRAGRFTDEYESDFDGSPAHRDFTHVVHKGEGLWYRGAPSTHTARIVREIEVVMVPLADDGNRVDRLMTFSLFRFPSELPQTLLARMGDGT